jgi:hypothetical protein
MPERQDEFAFHCAVPQALFALQRAKRLHAMLHELQSP